MTEAVKARRSTERRNRGAQVLDAAVKVFSEKGYAGSSLQDIADRVGLLKGSLYHYIDSKESLLLRIMITAHDEVDVIQQVTDQLDLPVSDRIERYTSGLAEWYLRNRDRARLYHEDWRYLSGAAAEQVRVRRRAFEGYLIAMIQEAVDAGLAHVDTNPKIATSFVLSAVNGVALRHKPDSVAEARSLAEYVGRMCRQTIIAG